MQCRSPAQAQHPSPLHGAPGPGPLPLAPGPPPAAPGPHHNGPGPLPQAPPAAPVARGPPQPLTQFPVELGNFINKLPPARALEGGHPNVDQVCPSERKEKKRKDYAFQRQSNEKPSITPGCPEGMSLTAISLTGCVPHSHVFPCVSLRHSRRYHSLVYTGLSVSSNVASRFAKPFVMTFPSHRQHPHKQHCDHCNDK